jgi:phytoene dehydrogenase-like protein
MFTQRLEKIAAGLGVKFCYNTTIESVDVRAGGRVGVRPATRDLSPAMPM